MSKEQKKKKRNSFSLEELLLSLDLPPGLQESNRGANT